MNEGIERQHRLEDTSIKRGRSRRRPDFVIAVMHLIAPRVTLLAYVPDVVGHRSQEVGRVWARLGLTERDDRLAVFLLGAHGGPISHHLRGDRVPFDAVTPRLCAKTLGETGALSGNRQGRCRRVQLA